MKNINQSSEDNVSFSFESIREVTEQTYFAIKEVFENKFVNLLGYLTDDVNNALLFRDRIGAEDFIKNCIYEGIRPSLDVVEIVSSELIFE